MTEEKSYTLRDLTADDIFPVLRILNKIGVNDVKKCFAAQEVRTAITDAAAGKDTDVSAVGVTVMLEIASLLIEHIPDCRDELYGFLASLSGKKKEDVAALPMLTFVRMIRDVVRKDEFRDFFGALTGFLNSENSASSI